MSTKIYKKRKFFERIVLIGQMHELLKWIDWCYENGYQIKRSGPKPISFYRVDFKKFKIVAEKEINNATV